MQLEFYRLTPGLQILASGEGIVVLGVTLCVCPLSIGLGAGLKFYRLNLGLQILDLLSPSPRRLASGEGIVVLGVTLCVCPLSRDCTRVILVSVAKVMICIRCSLA